MSISATWQDLIEGENIEIYNSGLFANRSRQGKLNLLNGYEDSFAQVSFRVFKVQFEDDIYYALVFERKETTIEERMRVVDSFKRELGRPEHINEDSFADYIIYFWLVV